MKSLGFSLLLLLLSFPVFSQYQFSNSGFESWGSNGEPTGWHSFATAGGTLGSTVRSDEQLEKSSNSHSGKSSVLIKSRDVKVFGIHAAYANAMLTTGQIIGGSTNAHSPQNHNLSNIDNGMAMAFTGRPDSLAIWLKSSFLSSSQKGRIHVLLHDKSAVTDPGTDWTKVVAVAGLNVDQYASWKRVSIPFHYKGETLSILCDVDGSSKTENHTPASSSARPSYVLATIASNYMAGAGSANDIMYIDDVAMIYNSSLKSLKINGSAVSGFSKTKYSYSVSTPYQAGCVSYEVDGRGATVETSYNASTYLYTITVKGDDYSSNSSNVHVYTIQFAPDKVYESLLTSLKVNGTSVANFSSSTLKYTVSNAAYATSEVTYTQSADATVEKSFNSSTNVLTLKVSGGDVATNPSNVHTYTVTFHAPFESLLTSLKVNGTSVANFSSSTLKYTVSNAAYATSEVTYTQSADATVEKSFNASTNVLTLKVSGGDVATNPSNVHTYTITFHAPFESVLTSLKVNGASVDSFSSLKFDYLYPTTYASAKVEYGLSTGATASKEYDPSSNMLTVTVRGADYATNPANEHLYHIRFSVPCQLTDLKVDGKTIAGFDKDLYAYTVDVTYAFSQTEWRADSTAVASASYDEGEATLTIRVTGKDSLLFPNNRHLYTVRYHVPYTSYLSSLTDHGKSLPAFSPTLFVYEMDDVYARSDIRYEADEYATATDTFDASTNILTITVKGGDIDLNKTNKRTYTVKFHAPYTSLLSDLSVDGHTLEGFSPDRFDYQVDAVYYKVDLGVLTDDFASYGISYDRNTYMLTIRVESGDFALDTTNHHEYRIQFNDHNVYNSELLAVSLNGVEMEEFSKETYSYEVEGSYADITLRYEADSLTTVTESFDVQENKLTITVEGGNLTIAPDNFHVYTFSFTQQFSYGAQITAVLYRGVPVDWFDKDVYEYTVDLAYNERTFSYTTNNLAEVYEFFDEESLTLSVVVIGGDMDYSNMNEYLIHFKSYRKDNGNNNFATGLDENPLQEELEGESGYTLYTLNGVQIRSGVTDDELTATADLPRGIYLLKRKGRCSKLILGTGK